MNPCQRPYLEIFLRGGRDGPLEGGVIAPGRQSSSLED